MTADSRHNGDFRFADFELDVAAQELYKGGIKVHLEVQPFQVLLKLLERPGEVVTREELKQNLWADDTFVDFNNGVNQAISKIRRALGGSAASPRFVETLPRRGYRFVGRIDLPEPAQPKPEPSLPNRRQWIEYAGVALAGTMAGVGLYHYVSGDPEISTPLRRFSFRPTDRVRGFSMRSVVRFHDVAISPNGRYIAFVGKERGGLWVQDLERNEPSLVPGVQEVTGPFWSPDSEFVLFTSQRTGLLQKAPLRGGTPSTICKVTSPGHGTVSNDGSTVVYTTAVVTELWQVSFGGGTPEPVFSQAEKEQIFAEHFGGGQAPLGGFPSFLPAKAGERVLVFEAGWPSTPRQQMMILDMNTRRRKTLPPGLQPAYSPTGHLIYGQGRNPVNLWALPFSLTALDAEGEAFLIARSGWQHSVSLDGTLVYLDWKSNANQLVWRDRNGRELGSIGAGEEPKISRSGSRVAYSRDGDIWVHDLKQGRSQQATADQAGDIAPVWSPDEKQLVFCSSRGGSCDIWMVDLDRVSEEPHRITSSAYIEVPYDWSLDGKHVVYHRQTLGGHHDLYFLTRDEENEEWKPRKFLATHHRELHPQLSPDGRFVAYFSYMSGRAEIYVQRFPEGGGLSRISTNEGRAPRWRHDSRELFYMSPWQASGATAAVFSVPVDIAPVFTAGNARWLFDVPSGHNGYDVSANGRRFLISESRGDAPELAIRVVDNWVEEFRDRSGD